MKKTSSLKKLIPYVIGFIVILIMLFFIDKAYRNSESFTVNLPPNPNPHITPTEDIDSYVIYTLNTPTSNQSLNTYLQNKNVSINNMYNNRIILDGNSDLNINNRLPYNSANIGDILNARVYGSGSGVSGNVQISLKVVGKNPLPQSS